MSLPVPATRVEQAIARIAQGLLAWRRTVAVLAILVTALLATAAMRTHLDAGFNKLIPLRHSYMQAFLQHAAQFSGANRVMVSVRWKGEGDIYNAQFLDTLRQITDEVFFIPGVNRGQVFSLYTPNVRYVEVTENGFVGEVLIPSRFNADAEGLAQVRSNVSKSGQIGRLVSKDQHAAMVRADLLETNPATGARLDYADVARKLEEIRTRHQSENIEIHIEHRAARLKALGPQFGDSLVDRVLLAAIDDGRGAGVAQSFSQRKADATNRAGNQGRAAGEIKYSRHEPIPS